MDELKEAEVALKEGSSIVMHEYKNQCQMNFTGELKGLEPNTEYSLWVADATTSGGCPDLTAMPTELTVVSPSIIRSYPMWLSHKLHLLLKVTTDANGEATIPVTFTREIRLFPADDSAFGKMVVIENPQTVLNQSI